MVLTESINKYACYRGKRNNLFSPENTGQVLFNSIVMHNICSALTPCGIEIINPSLSDWMLALLLCSAFKRAFTTLATSGWGLGS